MGKGQKESDYSGRLIILLYLRFIKLRFQSIIEYRGAFVAGVIAQIFYYAVFFSLIWIMISHFKTMNGWKPMEVMFLYALNLLSYSISACFVFLPFVNLPQLIQSGEFDAVCIKPMNPFLFLVTSNFNVAYLAHFSLSLAVMIFCIIQLKIAINWLTFFLLIIFILGAGLIQASAMLITSIPAFWIIQNTGLQSVFFFELKAFIQYPLSLYNRIIQIFFTFIIPYAFINFYPAQYFLKKNDFLMFHPSFQFLTPFVGLLLFFLAYRFWLLGLKNYQSTGS
jgi:ABC-2 type transport system permease protein